MNSIRHTSLLCVAIALVRRLAAGVGVDVGAVEMALAEVEVGMLVEDVEVV